MQDEKKAAPESRSLVTNKRLVMDAAVDSTDGNIVGGARVWSVALGQIWRRIHCVDVLGGRELMCQRRVIVEVERS